VVVCSARSGETKSTGTTNLLLRAALEALRPRAPDLSSSLASIGNPSTPDTSGPSTSDKVNPLTSQIFQRSTSNTVAAGTFINGSRSGDSTPSSSKGVSNSLSSSLAGLRMGDETPQIFNATIDQIKNDHIQSARRVIKNRETLKDLEDDLDYDCERLRSFLLAAQVM
jgi:aspartate kinase